MHRSFRERSKVDVVALILGLLGPVAVIVAALIAAGVLPPHHDDPEGEAAIKRWLSALRRGEESPGLASISGAQVLDAVANLRLAG